MFEFASSQNQNRIPVMQNPGLCEKMLSCKGKVPVQGHVYVVDCNTALMPLSLASASKYYIHAAGTKMHTSALLTT